ncbi:hypothetical protein DFH94DRAFT_736693 [Russula ochroleuca]|jgi:hypothetical protein|uniref:F-box domain-containing protein n=1 Tax=Russula ochroleuca TaxID=152965 RepID=A0A9P5T9E7_9AGAM|nr:hypothetical protein DFH94DRAFT_736693 [Russula ochroleuca]
MHPSCPVEIIDYILDLVVALPDLTTHLFPPYCFYTDVHDLPLSAIKLSTCFLYSLTLVCKQWNTICTPRLYRCLAVDDDSAIDLLLRTLEHSQTTAGGILPLGSLTRHLIIALSAPIHYQHEAVSFAYIEAMIQHRFGDLGRLARCLPHLQILSISIFSDDFEIFGGPSLYYGKDFAAAIIQTSAHSLLKLHLNHGIFFLFSPQELRKLLESTPNLVAIIGSGVRDTIGCPVALPYLPKLKYLVVNDVMGDCDRSKHEDNRTPFLDHIHIHLSYHSDYFVHLLSAQGARLTSVSLDLRPSNFASDWLSMLTSFCPNLSYLEICIFTWGGFPRLNTLPPIKRLGIRLHIGFTSVAVVCESLATIQSPSLEVVHLMNTDWTLDDGKSPWDPLVHRTFRVVDWDGRELCPGQSIKK